MIVCICRAVSDRAVRNVIHAGAATVEEVAHASGAGHDCGRCRPALAEMLEGQQSHSQCSGSCAGCTRHHAEATGALPLRAAAARLP